MKLFFGSLIAIFIFILNTLECSAQYTNIQVGVGGNEPSIMINPTKPEQMVAATNKAHIYHSSDSGKTWSDQWMPNPNSFSGDPCIVVDTQNTFYFFSLGGEYGNPNWLDQLVCYRSNNGGATWIDSSHVGKNSPKDQDKEWAVVDRRNDNIYMTWSEFDTYGSATSTDSSRILFSKSTDHGVSWSVPLRLNTKSGDCIDDDLTTEGAVPTVGVNGEIYVAWSDVEGIKFDRSFDEGNTWMINDVFVSTQPNGWNLDIPGISRANGLPVIDCDKSNSPYKGRLYINWTDQLNGINDTDVWISVSNDSGSTWSARKRVNDDALGKHQFFTWMTIDQVTGYIYIIFYDRRNYTNNKTDVYLAKSIDGGATFTNELISITGFTPSASVFFGDYTNISAHDNIVRPIWTRADGVNTSIWTALINYSYPTSISENEAPQNFKVYPSPAFNKLHVSYKATCNDVILFELFDVSGRKMKSISLPCAYTQTDINIDELHDSIYSYEILINNRMVKSGRVIKK